MTKNKKLMAAAIVIAFAASGLVFAQDEGVSIGGGSLKLFGEVKTGVRMDGTSKKMEGNEKGDTDNVPIIRGYSDDIDDGTGLRAGLGVIYTNGPLGFKLGIRQELGQLDAALAVNEKDDNRFKIHNAYGWLDTLKVVTFYGGLIDDALWGSDVLAGTYTDTDYDTGTHLKVSIHPIEGLSFGVAWNLEPTNSSASPVVGKDMYVDGFGQTPGAFFGRSIIGASYIKEDVFGAALTVRLNGTHYEAQKDESYFYGADLLFGVNVTAIPNLFIVVDGEFKNLFIKAGDAKDIFHNNAGYYNYHYGYDNSNVLENNYGTIALKGMYTVAEKIHVGARGLLKYTATNTDDSDIKKATDAMDLLEIRLYGNYDITEVVNAGIELAGAFQAGSKDQKDGTTGVPGSGYKNAKDGDGNKLDSEFKSFTIRPIFTFKYSEGAKFVIFDDITINNGTFWGWGVLTDTQRYTDNPISNPKWKSVGWIDNRFQIDFIWSF